MKFKGKVAIWFYGMILIYNLFIVQPIYHLFVTEFRMGVFLILIFTLVLLNITFIPLVVRNYVILDAECLIIHIGFWKESISYKDIKDVKPSHNPIASSAASLDRIAILSQTGNAMAYVAVREKKRFIEELRKKIRDS